MIIYAISRLALLLIAAVLSPIVLAVTDLKCQTLADSYL